MKRLRTDEIQFLEQHGTWYVMYDESMYYIYADESFRNVADNSIEYNYDVVEFNNEIHLKADNIKYQKCNYYTIQEII